MVFWTGLCWAVAALTMRGEDKLLEQALAAHRAAVAALESFTCEVEFQREMYSPQRHRDDIVG